MYNKNDFKKSKTCTPVGIMRHLNAGEVIFLVATDMDNGRLRIESYKFVPSKRMVSGRELAAWWAYDDDNTGDSEEFVAGMCYAKDRDTWLEMAEKYGKRTIPMHDMRDRDYFAWYLTGVHFFADWKKINAKFELFSSARAEDFCKGIETEFAEYYFDNFRSKG